MAKNYTFAEAVRIINAGVDMESITDIGRRYPTLLHKVTKVTTKAGEDFVDLMGYMPDYLTANKVNAALKNAAGGGNTESEDADTDANESADVENNDTAVEVATWNESMSAKQLWDILGKAGKRKLAKSTKKADLIEACKQAFGNTVEETEAEEVEDTEEATEAAETNLYEGKSAMELFKECKKRGIKTAPKKTAKFYADLLVKADAEATEATEVESDNWDEDEEEAKSESKKPAKKTEEKKPEKKAAKKEEANDDDDDWDI